MSLLFDTSPLFDETKRPQKRQRASKSRYAERKKTPIFIGESPADYVVGTLGRGDDLVVCADDSCRSGAHDIVYESRGEWFLQCVVCGTGQWLPVVPGHLPEQPAEAGFRLRDGRFAGMTIAEALRQPRGEDYIRWAAQSHPRDAVRAACKAVLTTSAAVD